VQSPCFQINNQLAALRDKDQRSKGCPSFEIACMQHTCSLHQAGKSVAETSVSWIRLSLGIELEKKSARARRSIFVQRKLKLRSTANMKELTVSHAFID